MPSAQHHDLRSQVRAVRTARPSRQKNFAYGDQCRPAFRFDSPALKVEKVIAGNSQGIVRVAPLNPGTYEFVGEYHEETAKGRVIAE
jgi:hypothetical protein